MFYRAEQDNFYPTKKFRRVGYDEDDGEFVLFLFNERGFLTKFLCFAEYSDTDMDDLLGAKSINKRRIVNQRRQAAVGSQLSNGFDAPTSNTNRRTRNFLPDEDVVSSFQSFPHHLTRHNLKLLFPKPGLYQ